MITLPSARALAATLAALTLVLAAAPPAALAQTHSLGFDGAKTYVSLGQFNVEVTFTVEGWFRTESNEGTQTIFSIPFGSGSSHFLVALGGERLRYYDSQTGTLWSPDEINVADGEWHHFAAVRRANSKQFELYLDGQLVAESGECSNSCQTNEIEGFGAMGRHRWNHSSNYFDGQLDDLNVWSRDLSEDEVWRRQFEAVDPTDPDLVAVYSFDEGSGDVLVNQADEDAERSIEGTVSWVETTRYWFEEYGTAEIADGSITLGDTDFALDVSAQSGGTFAAVRIDAQPGVLPTLDSGAADDRLLGDRYWVTSALGAEAPTASVVITAPNLFSRIDEADPAGVRLYRRAHPHGDWEQVATASEVDAAASAATFGGVDPTGAFMVGLGPLNSDFGDAITLDGVDGYLAVDGAVEHLGEGFTVETWVRPDEDASETGKAVMAMNTGARSNRFIVTYEGGASSRFALASGSGAEYGSGTFEPGRWYHVAVTGSEADGIALYIDGVLYVENPGWNNLPGVNGLFSLGQEWDTSGTSDHLAATFDEVRAWDEVRTVDEIRATRYLSLEGDEAGLVGYWPLGEESGSADVVGDAYMVLRGGAEWAASTAPLGETVTAVAEEAPGVVGFAGTGVEARYFSQDGAPVWVTRLSGAPAEPPAGTDVTSVLDAQSWLVERYETSAFNAALTFEADVTDSDEEAPSQIHLYSRPSGSDSEGDWVRVAAASEVDASMGTATFRGISGFSQFVLARGAPLDDAITLDGVDDYLAADGVMEHLTEGFTVETWVRPDESASSGSNTVLSMHSSTGGNRFMVYYSGGSVNSFRLYSESETLSGTSTYEPGRWYHVAVTGGSDGLALYIDGVLHIEDPTWNDYAQSDGRFSLGQEWDTDVTSQHLHATFDEVRAWDAVRTVDEIRATRYLSLEGDEAGLVGYWPLSENDEDRSVDVVGDTDMTLHGGAAWTASTAPLGETVTALAEEAPGVVRFVGTGVEARYLSQNGALVEVTRLGGAPTGPPAGAGVTTVLDAQSWFIERYERGLFNATLTFEVEETFTASDEALPAQIHLYSRPPGSESAGDWERVASASDVDASLGTATFRGIREFSQFVLVRGPVVPDAVLSATDDSHEDRVALFWDDVPPEAAELRVTRLADTTDAATITLSLLASDASEYDDYDGDPALGYTYCLVVQDALGNTFDEFCDAGSRRLKAPENLSASDALYDTEVALSWTDRSVHESGYVVFRDGEVLAGLGTNQTSYGDEDAVALTSYTYCVAVYEDADGDDAYTDGVDFVSETICDDGERGVILPPAAVAASDGEYPNHVEIAWTEQADGAGGYRVTRESPEFPFEPGLYFDGVDSYVDLGTLDALQLDGVNAFTIEMWVETTSSTNDYLLCQSEDGGSSSGWRNLCIFYDSNRKLGFWHGRDGVVRSASAYPSGSAVHLALVFDGTTGYVYVDGRLSNSASVSDVRGSSEGLSLGDWRRTTTTADYRPFKGKIDEVRFWSDVRTQEEIEANLYEKLGGDEANLVAYFPFDEGSGTTSTDLARGVTVDLEPGEVEWLVPLDVTVDPGVGRYEDGTASPGLVYTYCVRTVSADTESVAICDEGGIDVLTAPENVVATDETYDDRVLVTWDDVASTEDAFRIYRTHPDTDEVALLATTNAGEQAYIDADAEAGVAYAYCVEAVAITQDADGADQEVASAQDCDDGARSHVLPVSGVDATDGDYEDRVGLSWTNEATTAALLRVYRGGVLVKTTAAGNTVYEDLAVASGDTLAYCVEAVTPEGVASAQVCDDGFRVLEAPTSVTATDDAEEDEVVVTWSDNSAVEAGYEVYRQPSTPSAVLLSGEGDHVLIPTKDVISSDEGTLELWMRPSTVGLAMVAHAGETNGQGGGTQDELYFLVDAEGTVSFAEYATSEVSFQVRSTSEVTADSYVHVAVTWSASANRAALYMDGVLEDESDFPGFTKTNWNDEVKLGSHQAQDFGSRYFGGDLDEVRFWSVARSASEIQAGMTTTPSPAAEGLTASYAFDEGAGTRAADATGNGYDATLEEDGAAWGEQVGGHLGTLAGTKAASRLTLTDYAGAPGTRYTYRVRAFDEYGASETGADLGRRALAAPNSFAASDSTSETLVALSWSDESRVEEGYRIYRKAVGASDSTLVATTEQRATSYTDTLGADLIGTRFAYSVVAFDAYGTSASATEEGATGLLPPASVNASDGYENEVVLTWIDESGLEDGYEILRGLADQLLESQTWESLGTVDAGVTTFTDETAAEGTSYVYCVVTYSGDAHTGCTSAYDEGERFTIVAPSDATSFKLLASDGSEADRFGTASAILGDRAVVTATLADDTRGAAYVFEKVDDVWTQTARLGGESGCELAEGDRLGSYDVALTETHIAVGAPNGDDDDGFALVYEYDEASSTWGCVHRLDSTESGVDQFGYGIAMNSTHVFVGVYEQRPARVQIFSLASGDHTGTIEHPDGLWNWYGQKMAANDDYLLVGTHSYDRDAANAGTVFVYEVDSTGGADLVARLLPSDIAAEDQFGSSVALSGDYAVVGAALADLGSLTDAGAAYLFEVADWEDANGNDLGPGGDDVISQVLKLTPPDANTGGKYGFDVAISATSVLVGAAYAHGATSEEGKAYYYQLDEEETLVAISTLSPYDGAKEDHFGWSVAVDDDGTTLVGSRNEDELGNSAGAAYITASGLEPIFAPDAVTATDGTFDNRIQLAWSDRTISESGYRIYRDGEALTETSPNVVSYSDFDAAPGVLYTYCVETLSDLLSPSDQVCDAGWRPPNGSISGRVNSGAGAGIDSVQVCLAPPANLALLLDGVGGHLEIPDDQSLDIGDTFTLETWVRYSETAGSGSSNASIFDKSDGTTTPLALRVARTSATAGQVVCSRKAANGAVVRVFSDPETALNDDSWHHVACVGEVDSDGSATLSVYVNGVISNSADAALTGGSDDDDTSTDTSNDSPLYIGRRYDSENHYFAGRIDEVRLWTVARTSEQILADYTDALHGDEDDLAAYWPFDQETDALPTVTGRPNHAVRSGGAYPTESASPLDVCALTDDDGAFTLSGINYGEATTFSVIASRENRSFEPPTASIALTGESPVQNELIFIDVSSFSVAGTVSYPSPFDGTTCPAEDIEMYLGPPGGTLVQEQRTEKDGAYLMAADLGDYEVTPRREDDQETDGDGFVHTFEPSSRLVTVSGDVTNVNFDDTSTRRLTGFVGGGCGIGIGTIALRIYTENGCFTHEIEAEGDFVLDLPPQRYLAEVIDVELTADVPKADVLAYFDSLGPIEFDLSTQADTLEVIYEAPLSVAISGFPSEDEQICAADDALGVPVLYADESRVVQPVDVTITVQQDYGDGLVCRVEEGELTVFDEVATPAVSVELELEDGEATYEVRPGEPNILEGFVVEGVDRSYQKPLTAIAEVEGRDPVTEVAWVIVEGARSRTAEFVTMTTEPTPLLVLRDPPGDASFSSIEGGYADCTTTTDISIIGLEGEVKLETGFKTERDVLGGGGFGTIFLSTLADAEQSATYEYGLTLGHEWFDDTSSTTCVVIEEGLSTSAKETYIGPDADVIVGAGLNLVVGLADKLTVDGESCAVSLDEILQSGQQSDPFSTVYAYTQGHIRDHVIPSIENLMALDSTLTTIQLEEGKSVDLPLYLEGSRYAFTGDPVYLADARDNWVRQLQASEEARRTTLDAAHENRSFDAGSSISYSRATDSTSTQTNTYTAFTTIGGKKEWVSNLFALGKATVEVKGTTTTIDTETGEENFSRTVAYTLEDGDIGDRFTVDIGWDETFETYAFELRSGVTSNPWEPGPRFTDPFADCYYLDAEPCALEEAEGWPFSQPRDKPTLAITPPELIGVDPNEPAVFSLALGNESESGENRPYMLRALSTENPYGARLLANGAPITVAGGLQLEVDPGAVQNVTLEVLRGPTKYAYDSLAVMVYAPGEFDVYMDGGALQLADTVYFSVEYDAVCSDISILRPRDPWSRNAADFAENGDGEAENPLELILNDFFLMSEDLTVDKLGIAYRRAGTPNWTDIFDALLTYEAPSDDWSQEETDAYPNGRYTNSDGSIVLLPSATSYELDWAGLTDDLPDGDYELRAYTDCSGETVYSEVVNGTRDTAPPVALGTPQPADQVLHLGDDIAVEFAEPVACPLFDADGAGDNDNVLLQPVAADGTLGDSLAITLACDGTRLVIAPDTVEVDLDALEHQTLRATLVHNAPVAPADLLGNPLEGALTWDFVVRRSSVAFSPVSAAATVTRGTEHVFETSLVNGRGQPVAFTLADSLKLYLPGDEGVPADSVALAPSAVAGDVVSGGSYDIAFVLPDTLALGTWSGSIAASLTENVPGGTVALGTAPFYVTADVACEAPPSWTVRAADFEQSMTVFAQLAIDGSPSVDENDVIAAYVDGEVRGVAALAPVVVNGETVYQANLIVYSNGSAGELVSLRVWDDGSGDDTSCQLYTDASPALVFDADAVKGSVTQPIQVDAPAVVDPAALYLEAGWTWISINTDETDPSVSGIFADVSAVSGDLVKSQSAFSQHDTEYGWVGSLAALTPGEAYLVFLQQSSALVLDGTPTTTTTVNLTAGWNWLGYLPDEALPLGDALEDMEATDGDLIKSQTAFAQYSEAGGGWVGSLGSMEPGKGYRLNLAEATTLTYPTVDAATVHPADERALTNRGDNAADSAESMRLAKTAPQPQRVAKAEATETEPEGDPKRESGPGWLAPAQQHPFSMTVVAALDEVLMAQDGALLGAFVGEELRGVAAPTFVEALGGHRVFVVVHGSPEDDAPLTLRAFAPESAEVISVDVLGREVRRASLPEETHPSLRFEPGASLGSVTAPLELRAVVPYDPSRDLPTAFALEANHPNPFVQNTTLRYDLPVASEVSLTVYDALGRRVAVVVDAEQVAGRYAVDFDAAQLASGVYFVRMHAGVFVEVRRMVRLR